MESGIVGNFRLKGFDKPQQMTIRAGRIRQIAPCEGPVLGLDLQGAEIAPAFIDSHCHILPTGLDLHKLNLDEADTPEKVLEAVLDWHKASSGEGWLHAVHYDQTRFPDGLHLTRLDLDRVSPDRPILLRHVNGHASVANSAALRAAGVSAATPDPSGGEFLRGQDGEPNGVLLERAHEQVSNAAPEPSLDQMIAAILEAGEKMAQLGIGTATDMMTGRWNLENELTAYRIASERGCKVRLRLFLQWGAVLGKRGLTPERLKEHQESSDPLRCKVLGLKIFADGAISSATAAISGVYVGTTSNGQLIYAPERLKQMARMADEAGWRLATHTIGDRSTDLVLDAYEATADPSRHRIEHAMLLSDQQIERISRLGSLVTMQPEFLARFGHAYRRQLGPERAAKLKRFRSVIDAGISLSFSSDRPIVPGDPRDGIGAATSRLEGFDPGENCTLEEAYRAYTVEAAKSNFEESDLGRLGVGYLADYRIV